MHLGGQVIETTAEHPFYIEGKGWTPVKELHPGDLIIGNNGSKTAIDLINFTSETKPVYNIRVSEDHTYFVGGDGWGFSVWVHNTYSVKKFGTENGRDIFRVWDDTLNGGKGGWAKNPKSGDFIESFDKADIGDLAGSLNKNLDEILRIEKKLKRFTNIPWGKLCKSGCEVVARKIQRAIGGKIHKLKNLDPRFTLGQRNGIDTRWDWHEVVVRDGRVYDAMTGPKGQTIQKYKNSWGIYKDAIDWTF